VDRRARAGAGGTGPGGRHADHRRRRAPDRRRALRPAPARGRERPQTGRPNRRRHVRLTLASRAGGRSAGRPMLTPPVTLMGAIVRSGLFPPGAGTTAYRRAWAVAVLAALAVTTGCSGRPGPEPSTTAPATTVPPGDDQPQTPHVPEVTDVTEVLATDLSVPWDVDFLPDGAALVTERTTGRILRLGPESEGGHLRVSQVATIDVHAAGEGGLLGIAVSPRYASDRTFFVYYTTPADN